MIWYRIISIIWFDDMIHIMWLIQYDTVVPFPVMSSRLLSCWLVHHGLSFFFSPFYLFCYCSIYFFQFPFFNFHFHILGYMPVYDMVRYGLVWFGLAWYMVWCDMMLSSSMVGNRLAGSTVSYMISYFICCRYLRGTNAAQVFCYFVCLYVC